MLEIVLFQKPQPKIVEHVSERTRKCYGVILTRKMQADCIASLRIQPHGPGIRTIRQDIVVR
jgi:hypothetical protein